MCFAHCDEIAAREAGSLGRRRLVVAGVERWRSHRGGAPMAPGSAHTLRQLVRLACAAFALLLIAGLTSIGLYSVVAGGLLNNLPAARSALNGVPVLVQIQAGQATPTPSTTAGANDLSTPGPVGAARVAPAPAVASGGAG